LAVERGAFDLAEMYSPLPPEIVPIGAGIARACDTPRFCQLSGACLSVGRGAFTSESPCVAAGRASAAPSPVGMAEEKSEHVYAEAPLGLRLLVPPWKVKEPIDAPCAQFLSHSDPIHAQERLTAGRVVGALRAALARGAEVLRRCDISG
jgi:hypothetical protein